MLKEILDTYDKDRIEGLLNGDQDILKRCIIEKWARIAATDILLTNTYSRLTFTTISNLPIKDYQLIMKRVEEMVTAGRNITFQSTIITDNTPGT
jgi:Zn-finger domain-containing protein